MSFNEDMKKIGESISASYDARIGTLEDIYKDTQSTLKNARSMVKDFHGERMHMSEELRSDLEHFRKELTDETEKLMSETRKMMNLIGKQNQEMATQLREDLDKFHHTMYKETHTMMNEFRSSFEKMADELHKMLSSYYKGEIQKPVHDMLGTFHSQMNAIANDFQKARQAWLSFSRSMGEKRGMKPAPKKMQGKTEQICSILQEHPKGMTPGQIAKGIGCSPQSIRTPMSNLKKQGRIGKKQNKYYYKG